MTRFSVLFIAICFYVNLHTNAFAGEDDDSYWKNMISSKSCFIADTSNEAQDDESEAEEEVSQNQTQSPKAPENTQEQTNPPKPKNATQKMLANNGKVLYENNQTQSIQQPSEPEPKPQAKPQSATSIIQNILAKYQREQAAAQQPAKKQQVVEAEEVEEEEEDELEEEEIQRNACEEQVIKNFTKYFQAVKGCEFSKEFRPRNNFCADNGTNDYPFAYFSLKKPLKLRGELEITNKGSSECASSYTVGAFHSITEAGKGLDGYSIDFSSSPKALKVLEKSLPQWFKDGVLGSVWFEVEFEVQNRKEKIVFNDYYGQKTNLTRKVAFKAQKAECGLGDNRIYAKNIRIIRHSANKDSKQPRSNYEMSDMDTYGLKLLTNEPFAYLLESPNGRILTRIHMKERDEILIYQIQEAGSALRGALRVSKSKAKEPEILDWYKVIYFPPHIEEGEDAIVGYVHKSEVEHYDADYKAQNIEY